MEDTVVFLTPSVFIFFNFSIASYKQEVIQITFAENPVNQALPSLHMRVNQIDAYNSFKLHRYVLWDTLYQYIRDTLYKYIRDTLYQYIRDTLC